ncbi:MAG TPA: hypothetical protein VFE89_09045 [Beijerinckiaceae bacterium]|nr:hypothetical protein [Beijerinckiaceae bacterium]
MSESALSQRLHRWLAGDAEAQVLRWLLHRICVSSCPLIFVGGVKRVAGAHSIIGVHQVFAPDPAEAARHDTMSQAQRVSARCQRYLADMGVDLKMWVHAMETPKDRLFIFPANELRELNIVTPTNVAANAEGSEKKR